MVPTFTITTTASNVVYIASLAKADALPCLWASAPLSVVRHAPKHVAQHSQTERCCWPRLHSFCTSVLLSLLMLNITGSLSRVFTPASRGMMLQTLHASCCSKLEIWQVSQGLGFLQVDQW